MQFFNQTFTYANGPLTDADFERVFPVGGLAAGVEAIIASNAAHAGTVASKKIYRSLFGTNGQSNVKVRVSADWANAVGAGRWFGLGVRVQDDGDGYFAIFDSNLGVPQVSLIRRVGGAETTLIGPVTMGPLSGADLNAGVTLELRIETITTGVKIRVKDYVGGTIWIDHEDTDNARIESLGFVGLMYGTTSVNNDIVLDNLIAEDFEDEAEDITEFGAGLGIVLNGVYLAEYQWREMGIVPLSCTVSYQPVGRVAMLGDMSDAHRPTLKAGDRIAIIQDDTFLAEGVLRKVDQGFQPPETVAYEVIGARDLSAEVPIEDPETQGGVLGFNQEPDSELFDADRGDASDATTWKTIGEVLIEMWTNAADGDDGLRVRGAAPASGDLFVQAEVDLLDAKIVHLAVSGNVLQAEETLLGFMPEFAIWIDPETKIRHVHKRSTAAFKEIDLGLVHAIPQIVTDPSKNRTVVIVRGVFQEASQETFSWVEAAPSPDGLQPDWQGGLQSKIDENKKWLKEHTFDVVGNGITGGHIYVDLDNGPYPIEENEWRGTDLFFYTGPQAGNTYRVLSNTNTGRIVATATAWVGGTPPDNGDQAALRSAEDNGGLPNGFDDVGTAFTLPTGKSFAGGLCGDATITKTSGGSTKSYKVKVTKRRYTNPDTNEVVEGFKVSRTGVVIFDPEKDLTVEDITLGDLCEPSADFADLALPDSVEITVNVLDDERPHVPKIREPEEGWSGTAFSFDSAKYGTGQGPGPGDVGVRTPHIIEDSNFTDLLLQGAEFRKYAASVLAVLSTLAREGSCVIDGIDTSYAGLNFRTQISDPDRTTGFEAATDLWGFQVDYDFVENETRISWGTLSSGNVSIEAFRQKFAEKTRLDARKALERRLAELMGCMRDSQHGGTALSGDGPLGTPSCEVLHHGEPLDDVIDNGTDMAGCAIAVVAPDCEQDCIPVIGSFEEAANRLRQGIINGDKSNTLLCKVAQDVSRLWTALGNVLGSVGAELKKAQTDFANVRTAGVALSDCVDVNTTHICNRVNELQVGLQCVIDYIATKLIPCIAATFAIVEPGSGVVFTCDAIDCTSSLECVPVLCEFTFTETVCENPCPVKIS